MGSVSEDLAAIVAFIEERLADWEAWALAASRPYEYADGRPSAPEGGLHWRWGSGDDWHTVEPSLDAGVVDERGHYSFLLTVEQWPSRNGKWMMSRSYSDHVAGMDSAAAGHIIRHDPASTLSDVASTRALLAEVLAEPHYYVDGDAWFSCSQAVLPDFPGRDCEPGSGCSDDERRGKPCDCGRDARVRRRALMIAARWKGQRGWQEGWTA
jgi:hypothetical protein